MPGVTKEKPAPKRKGPALPRYEGPYTREHQQADIQLADDYTVSLRVYRSPRTIMRLLQRAAKGPDAKLRGQANYHLGELHEEGAKGHIKRDPYVARSFYEKAAADGDNPASIRMLRMEHFPEVYIKLRAEEFAPPRRGEKSPGSLVRANDLYDQKKYAEALPILVYHAKRGSSHAQYTLAIMHGVGDGVEADVLRARAWCYLAAKNGLEEAESALGCDLVFDRIVPSDVAEFWLKRAIRRNDPEAIGHFGILNMHSLDWRRKPNQKLGLRYLEKAASLGSAFAMLRLGEIYLGKVFQGSVTPDIERAKALYIAAADAGDEEAIKLLRRDFRLKYLGRGTVSAITPRKRAAHKPSE